MKGKKCFKCGFMIDKNENYFEFNEFMKNEIVNTDYCHKVCWDDIKGTLLVKEKAMGILGSMENWMKRFGITPKEEYIIK